MRIAPKNICLLFLTSLVSGIVNAQTPPPPPVPVGPGFPINENLIVLGVAGVLLAAVYFYRSKKKVLVK